MKKITILNFLYVKGEYVVVLHSKWGAWKWLPILHLIGLYMCVHHKIGEISSILKIQNKKMKKITILNFLYVKGEYVVVLLANLQVCRRLPTWPNASFKYTLSAIFTNFGIL